MKIKFDWYENENNDYFSKYVGTFVGNLLARYSQWHKLINK